MDYLYYGGGFLVFVVLALRVHRVVVILSFRLRTPKVRGILMESVPREILAALAPGATELRGLGFELSHFMTVTDLNAGIQSPAHASVYYNPVYDCYADLNASLTPDRAFPYRVNFYSFFDDGLLFLTMNQEAYSVIEGSPSLIAKDAFALTLSEQLTAHRDGVERFENSSGRLARKSQLEPAEFVSILNSNYADYTAFLCEQGWAYEENSHFRFAVRAAVHLSSKILKAEKRVKALQASAAKEYLEKRVSLNETDMVTLEVDAYQRHDQIRENSRLNRAVKGVLLISTILLFGAVFGVTWSLDSLLILIGVVLFHELGHILAMHLCGYRDLQILFIPFLGAAAMGKADNPKAWQKAFVSLMGPLPGLLVGTALLWQGEWIEVTWLGQLTLILLVVNFLNLLPIMPLDGGQLLNAVLFNHHPRWQFGFFVLSVALLLGWALVDSGPLLFVMFILMAFQIPTQYRSMRLSLGLLTDDAGPTPPQEPLRRVFHALSAGFTDNPAYVAKYPLARELLERLSQTRPSWREVTASLLLYIIALLVPFTYLGYAAYEVFAPYKVETDWEAKIAATENLPTQLEQYVAASYDYMAAEDNEQAMAYLDRAKAQSEAARFYGEEYAQVLQVMTSLYGLSERNPEPLYLRLIEVRTDLDGVGSLSAAQAHYNYAHYLLSSETAFDEAALQLQAILEEQQLDENRRKYAGNRAGWVHLLRGEGAEARALFDRVHASQAVDEESLLGSGRYQFIVDGSAYRHILLMAVSHWAEGDTTAAAAELSRGEALAGGGFMTDLREYAELLHSLRETTEPGIESRSYELILAMLDELAPGDSNRQAAKATRQSTTGV